jgi:hypothetical protein
MHAQGFHDSLATQFGFQAEKIFERAVGKVNFPVTVEQQQAFKHGIEENLLLRLRFDGRLPLPFLKILDVRLQLPLLVTKFLPPPKMDGNRRNKRENEKGWPHGNSITP